MLGAVDGLSLGLEVGLTVGYLLGATVGGRDGETVGVEVEGFSVGVDEGDGVGSREG